MFWTFSAVVLQWNYISPTPMNSDFRKRQFPIAPTQVDQIAYVTDNTRDAEVLENAMLDAPVIIRRPSVLNQNENFRAA